MKKRLYTETTNMENRFLLNLLILADALEERFNILQFSPQDPKPSLKGIRHYRSTSSPSLGYVYLIEAQDVTSQFSTYHNVQFIVIGTVDTNLFSKSSSFIILEDTADIIDVFDYVLHIFQKYFSWDLALQRAVNTETPLDDMLEASIDIFQNPLFIHDTDFYVLACPKYVEGMTIWDTDPRTGRNIVPLNVINDFKIDTEYLHTLQTRHADMFSANQRGYRILYKNLWNNTHYEGRICVNELQSIIKPGDYLVLDYLSKMVLTCILRRNAFWMSMGHNSEQICEKILDRKITDEREIGRLLRFWDWNMDDQYLVLKLGTEQESAHRFTVSALGHIEIQIAACHALFYDEGIVAIVNLTASHASPSQVVSSLSFLVREGLFKIGVSDVNNNFAHLPEIYTQAAIALEYGSNSESMIWCFYFRDYVLDYVFEKACEKLPWDFICAKQTKDLQEYDDKHNTKLNETLETYLHLERNVVQTAKTLFIHRSTLFYRLERIQKIINANLDDPKTRLYLEISYYMKR